VTDSALELPGGSFHLGIEESLLVAGSNVDALTILQQQRPVAIELDFIQPLGTLGERLHDLGGHRLDERGRDGAVHNL
jgi:hypothetical protein